MKLQFGNGKVVYLHLRQQASSLSSSSSSSSLMSSSSSSYSSLSSFSSISSSSVPSGSSSSTANPYLNKLLQYLVSKKFKIYGKFYIYDFNHDGTIDKSDWIFEASASDYYRLLGVKPSENNAFGWQKLSHIPADLDKNRDLQGYFSYIAFNEDSDQRFSWIYVTKDGAVYKLMGATSQNTFYYLDIDGNNIPDELLGIRVKKEGKNLIIYCDGSYPACMSGSMNIESLLPGVNIDDFINNPPSTTLNVEHEIESFSLQKADGSIELALDKSEKIDDTHYKIFASLDNSAINKPLFVGENFIGMIESIDERGAYCIATLKDPQKLEDVIKELSFKVKSRETNFQRTLRSGILKSKYDAYNKDPLRYTIYYKGGVTRDGGVSRPVMRIEIPKGYKIPLSLKDIECHFDVSRCELTRRNISLSGEKEAKVPLDFFISFPDERQVYLEFSTQGSFIDIGLAFFTQGDLGWSGLRYIEYTQDMYFDAHLEFSIKGDLTKIALGDDLHFEKDISLGEFRIPIPLDQAGGGKLARLEIGVVPTITVGIEGKIDGQIVYKYDFGREGYAKLRYDSFNGINIDGNCSERSQEVTQSNLNVSLSATGKAYLFPNVSFIPYVKLVSDIARLKIGILQSGITLDNVMVGKISKEFIAQPLDDENAFATEAQLTSNIYGLVRGKLDLETDIKGKKINDIYETDYINIYKTTKYSLLDWHSKLLLPPQLRTKGQNNTQYAVEFFNKNTDLQDYIKYCYNTGSSVEETEDISIEDIQNCPQVWKRGDSPLYLPKNTALKVRAFLRNADISSGKWTWGSSVSMQQVFFLFDVEKPQFSPASTTFEDSITITLTQSQGATIYYRIGESGDFIRYTGPFTLHESSKVYAYALLYKEGTYYKSKTVIQQYEKASGNTQCLPFNGQCLPLGEEVTRWEGFPAPEYCSLHAPDDCDFGENRSSLCTKVQHREDGVDITCQYNPPYDQHGNEQPCSAYKLYSEQLRKNGKPIGYWKWFKHKCGEEYIVQISQHYFDEKMVEVLYCEEQFPEYEWKADYLFQDNKFIQHGITIQKFCPSGKISVYTSYYEGNRQGYEIYFNEDGSILSCSFWSGQLHEICTPGF